jgi:anti-sigma B factor antagonist
LATDGRSVGAAPLSVTRSATDRGEVCLALAGELDMSNLHRLREPLFGSLDEPGVTGVIVDLADLEFMDSMGVQVLLQAKRHATSRQVGFAVINAGGRALRVLTIIGVHDLLAAGA